MKTKTNSISNDFNSNVLTKEGQMAHKLEHLKVISEQMAFNRIEDIIVKYNKKYFIMSQKLKSLKAQGTEYEFNWEYFKDLCALRRAAYHVQAREQACDNTSREMRNAYKAFMKENAELLRDSFDVEELLDLGLLTAKELVRAKEQRVEELEWAQVNSIRSLDWSEQRAAVEDAIGLMSMENIVDIELEDVVNYMSSRREDAADIGSYYTGKRSVKSPVAEENNSSSFFNDDLAIDPEGSTEQFIAKSSAEIIYGRAQEFGSDTYFEMGFDASDVRDSEFDFIGNESEINSLRSQEDGIAKKLIKDLEVQSALFKQEREFAEKIVAEFETHALAFIEEVNPNKVEDVYARNFLSLDNLIIDFVDFHYQQQLFNLTNNKRTRVGRGLIVYVDKNQCSESQIAAHEKRVKEQINSHEFAAFIGTKVGIYFDQYMTKQMRSVLYKAAKNFIAKKEAEKLTSAFDKVAQWFDCLDKSTKFNDAVQNIVSEVGMETLVLAVKASWKGTKFSLIEYKVLQACGAVDQAKGITPVIKDNTVEVEDEVKEVIEKLNNGVAIIAVVNQSNAKKVLAAARAGHRINNVNVYRAVAKMA